MTQAAPASSWRAVSVLVAGASGLVGSAFVRVLLEQGATVRATRHIRPVPQQSGDLHVVDVDLLSLDACVEAVRGVDVVINAAGVSGGSKRVVVDPLPMFTNTLLISLNLLEAARRCDASSFILVSNSSVYAPAVGPLRESDEWGDRSAGPPENPMGMVKRAAEVQCALYGQASDMTIAVVRGANTYGPHDNFDLENAHVIPALIHKAVREMDPFEVWGSPDVVRDFIYVDDLARGALHVLRNWASKREVRPVNIGTGRGVTVRRLVELILSTTEHCPSHLVMHAQAPPASLMKLLDVSSMRTLGFQPAVSLERGLALAVDWFRQDITRYGQRPDNSGTSKQ